jgi:hypothetical protein
MDTENLTTITSEELKALEQKFKVTELSPTQASDLNAILFGEYVEYLVMGGRDSGKSFDVYLALAMILSGRLGRWKANILLMRNTKEGAKKTMISGMLGAVLKYLGKTYEDLQRASRDRGNFEIDGHTITIDSFDADINNEERLKGMQNVTHVFIEEFNEIKNWHMYNQLYQTIREATVIWKEKEEYIDNIIDSATGEITQIKKYRVVQKEKKMEGKIIATFNTPEAGSPILNTYYDLQDTEYEGFFKPIPKSGLIYDKDPNTGDLIPNPNGFTYADMRRYYSFSTVYDNTVLRKSKLKEGENGWKLYLYRKHEMYRTTDPYYFFTNTLGLVGTGRSGRVFNNWESISLEEYKKIEATEFYGIDWGFSGEGDPSALTAVKHVPAQKLDELPCIYVNNLLYEKGLSLPDLVKRIMQSVPNYANVDFYIDHMPVAKSELIDKGFSPSYIHLADKGSGSRATSVSYIAGNFKVYFVDNKVLQKEVEKYRWLLDRDGRPTGEPSDGDDHIIDSIKYPVYTKLHPKQNEKSNWWKEYYRLLAQAEA